MAALIGEGEATFGAIDVLQHNAAVEVHAANSYLLDQFSRDSMNQRIDQYGGSVENEWQDSGRVGIRLSPTTPNASNTPPESDVMGTCGYLIW